MSREPLKGPDPSLPELAFAPELSDCMCRDIYGIFFYSYQIGLGLALSNSKNLSDAAII